MIQYEQCAERYSEWHGKVLFPRVCKTRVTHATQADMRGRNVY